MPEQNRATIRRLADGFWNKKDLKVFDEVFASHFVDHTPMPGREGTKEGFKAVAIALQVAVPDGHTTLDNVVAERDKVAYRWMFRGTHKGPLMGIPATGKPITITGITIDRVANGQIVERWSQVDSLGMMQQLGLVPAPGQPR